MKQKTVLHAAITSVALLILGATLWFAFMEPPVERYNVGGVGVSCDHDVNIDDCPTQEAWREFAEREIARFIDAGVLETEREAWRWMRRLRWRYIIEFENPAYGRTFPGSHSVVVIQHALTPGTDGHELRLQLCHMLRGDRGERDDMDWMHEHGVYPYPRRD